MRRTVFRTCTLCEACCGLAFEVEGDRIVSVRPDEDDVLSHGYVCPKGIAIADVHDDPDRLRQPLCAHGRRRVRAGELGRGVRRSSAQRLDARSARAHGADAIAVYIGNPIVHNHGALHAARRLPASALGTRNCTSAGSQDTSPRFAASYYLYGSSLVDSGPGRRPHATTLLVRRRQPGGLATAASSRAPNMRGRLRAIRARGGKRRRRRSAAHRDGARGRRARRHPPRRRRGAAARDGAGAGRRAAASIARRSTASTRGWDGDRGGGSRRFTPERVAPHVGVAAADHRAPGARVRRRAVGGRVLARRRLQQRVRHARDLGDRSAEPRRRPARRRAAARCSRARRSTSSRCRAHDRRRRPRPLAQPRARPARDARRSARRRCSPRRSRRRAADRCARCVTFAGNPVLSTPNGRRLDAALGELDFMVVDRSLRERDDAPRRRDPAAGVEPRRGPRRPAVPELRRAQRRALVAAGRRARATASAPTGRSCSSSPSASAAAPTGTRWLDRASARRQALRLALDARTRMVDLLLRTGPLRRPLPAVVAAASTCKKLEAAPHGIDLGPLEPGVARRVFHRDRKSAPRRARRCSRALDALARDARAAAAPTDELLLIGRRELRTNNSWMHNVPRWSRAASAACCSSIPTTRGAPASPTATSRVLESRVHSGPAARARHRRDAARRRQPAARLGTRRERAVAARRRRAAPASRPTTGPTISWSSRSSASRS